MDSDGNKPASSKRQGEHFLDTKRAAEVRAEQTHDQEPTEARNDVKNQTIHRR